MIDLDLCKFWHVTHNTWHMTHGGGEHVSSPALMVWDWQCLEDSEQKDHRLNEWINNEGVCKTARLKVGKGGGYGLRIVKSIE